MPKTIMVMVMVFILLVSVCTVAVGQAEQSLVGYWNFDEGSGEVANDTSGKGNDGKFVGDPKWVDGKYDKALEFGGDGSHVAVSDSNSLDLTSAGTYMFWFNPSSPIAGGRLMSKNNSIFIITDFGAANSIAFLVKPGNDFAESATTNWKLGEWYHFAGTYGDKTLQVYIDGELEGEKGGVAPIAASNLELWIGADDLPASFSGIMDDVRIYSKALTQEEIKVAMSEPMAVQMTDDKLSVTWGSLRSVR